MKARREAAGLDPEAVAKQLRCTSQKVHYTESGERAFQARDLTEVLLPLYGVPEDEWSIYVHACEVSRHKGWWERYDQEIIRDWFAYYVGLEQGASELSGFAMQIIPGLLQTRAYARAIMTASPSDLTDEQAASRLEVRVRRQEILTRSPRPAELNYVLDEAVLRRVVGSREVMAEQLEYLIELTDLDHITLQVLTFNSGYYFDGKGEPVHLRFPWANDPGVIYVEGLTTGECLEGPAVADYTNALNHVRSLALSPVESVTMIRETLKDHQ